MNALEYYNSDQVPPRDYWEWWHEQGTVWPCYDIVAMLNQIPFTKSFLENKSMTDLGSGPGPSIQVLNSTFHFSQGVAIDGAINMLDDIKQNHPLRDSIVPHCVDLESEGVPLDTESQALVVACCSVSYIYNITHVLTEAARIVCKEGFIAFDTWIHWDPSFAPVIRDSGIAVGYAHAFSLIDSITTQYGLVLVDSVEGLESDISDDGWPLERQTFLYQKK
jgi:SAM-dependent methyltransferase